MKSEGEITAQLLAKVSMARSLDELLDGITSLLQSWSGCEAVGVRLQDGDDFPYWESRGFPSGFVLSENSICSVDKKGRAMLDDLGEPVLECMCGTVISERTDPELSFFTKFGSFWTNSTSELLASTNESQRRSKTRNRCHGEGYESVALIPLRASGKTYGLLQFNDKREGMFSAARIAMFERLAHNVASAVAQQKAMQDLRVTEEDLAAALVEITNLKERLEQENVYLREEIRTGNGHDEIVGQSETLRSALSKIEHVARTDANVLLLGETGTGKELFARAIHDNSMRKERPLVKVNCASLPASLIESELFGHVKGAFTGALADKMGRFELADGGTIFLDEIGDLDPSLQTKLLRVLQEGEFERIGATKTQKVDVRVIAATNRDVLEAMQEGSFRPDLYYRLAVFPIEIPPLRLRRDDITLLAWHFIQKKQRRLGKNIISIPDEVLLALTEYDWPGNVRELENVIERAVILSPDETLVLEGAFSQPARVLSTRNASCNLEDIDRDHIVGVLEDCQWRVKGIGNTAERLGLKPSTLRYRMKKLGIHRPPRQPR